MSLFNFGKKEEEKAPGCACQSGCETAEAAAEAAGGKKEEGALCVKVLGMGCAACHAQFAQAKEAVKNMGLPVEVAYITDLQTVMSYGAMRMPAIVVNEKVVAMGKVLKAAEVEKLLRKLGF